MKEIILLILIGLIISGAKAQKIKSCQVPDLILKDFSSKYSNAKRVKWIREELNYEVEFIIKGKGMDVTYDTVGNWVETLSEITVNELPSVIVGSINKLFSDCKITSAARLDQYNTDAYYEAEIKYKGKKSVATFDSKGNQKD
jgi:hypothetical protein